MSLIEQAAKRLEELRRAGADIPGVTTPPAPRSSVAMVEAEEIATVDDPTRSSGISSLRARGTTESPARLPEPAEPPPRPTRAIEIDLQKLKANGFITPDAMRSQIADEYRVIKRPIIRNAMGSSGPKVRNGNLVMVTSALPGEGKTFTAVNLAISIAMELGTTVLLVDGDVAHPSLPDLLGAPQSPGLLELLTSNDVDVNDALFATNIDNLSILPAGSYQRRATELLASEQMASLVRSLAIRYPERIIVFDSPPLLATTEARVLASHMGQIVMVVAADATRQNAVNLALSTIENCEVVLMMLNKANKTDVGAYYGYYGNDAPT
jgi:protein-tyrosine kinase